MNALVISNAQMREVCLGLELERFVGSFLGSVFSLRFIQDTTVRFCFVLFFLFF